MVERTADGGTTNTGTTDTGTTDTGTADGGTTNTGTTDTGTTDGGTTNTGTTDTGTTDGGTTDGGTTDGGTTAGGTTSLGVGRAGPGAKGLTVLATLAYIRRTAGEERMEAVLGRLPEKARRGLKGIVATEEVPWQVLSGLLRAADAVLAADDPGWIEAAGAYAIESLGVEYYGGILRKKSPLEFLMQPVSLFQLYYHPGNMEVVEAGTGLAVLRLVGFEHGNVLFCRRQTGGLRRALELAGGRQPTVRHVRCTEDGDGYCEWELRWGEAGE